MSLALHHTQPVLRLTRLAFPQVNNRFHLPRHLLLQALLGKLCTQPGSKDVPPQERSVYHDGGGEHVDGFDLACVADRLGRELAYFDGAEGGPDVYSWRGTCVSVDSRLSPYIGS